MSVTRGKFLRSLGSSLPGYILGGGVASAAQTLARRIAFSPDQSSLPVNAANPATDIRFVERGPATGNRLALTFDDGPNPEVTNLILDQLKQRGILATFFMIGERVEASPDLARRVLAEGHEIGNHTFTHPKLGALSDARVEDELRKTQEILLKTVGRRATWFRPPYGDLRKNQGWLARKHDLDVVLWTIDSTDWAQPGEATIIARILSPAQAGAIIVCHDNFAQTANCIGQVVDQLLVRGFNFVTVSSLLTAKKRMES